MQSNQCIQVTDTKGPVSAILELRRPPPLLATPVEALVPMAPLRRYNNKRGGPDSLPVGRSVCHGPARPGGITGHGVLGAKRGRSGSGGKAPGARSGHEAEMERLRKENARWGELNNRLYERVMELGGGGEVDAGAV